MALKSSGIERPSDLVGKKVGYPGLPTDEPLLETMLKFDGANGLGDVELVRVGFNLTESLISGTVDAVVGAYWTHESILLENLGHPVNILKVQDWGVPDYYELVLVVSEKYIEEQSDVIERFTRALSKGFADAISDPQAGVNILIDASNEEVDRAIEGPGADLLVPLWKTNEANFGVQTSARWVDFASWMQETGLLSQEVDASKAFTDKFIK
jgi:putative hydroxymethylpyrimidine transport system substrate-binding protein